MASSRRTGFTLVELLVVLALISLVAGIAVPTIVRVASQNRNALRDTALDLQESLRASKVNAQTRRLDTALAYLIRVEPVVGGEEGATVAFIDGVVHARVPSDEELAIAGFRDRRQFEALARQVLPAGAPNNARIFIPVPLRGAEVRAFRGVGAMYDEATANFPESGANSLLNNPGGVQEEMGIIPIYLLDHTTFFNTAPGFPLEDRLELLAPRGYDDPTSPDTSFASPGAYPAHVFQPNGVMQSNSSKQRFELIVSARPTADEFEQWVDPWGEAPGFQGDRGRLHYRIELFAALGRVRLGTDLVAGFES